MQNKFRLTNEDWKSAVTEYYCINGTNHKFTQNEYLQKLANSKYGLCLRGFGSKCHREIELMALGTIPLITPQVSITSYFSPPIENIHYLKVSNTLELKEKISKISNDKWLEMSVACQLWYTNNIHSSNCWQNMINNILYNS